MVEVVAALISLSFLGSALYMIAGKGEGSVENVDFGDETTNQVFSMYRSFDKYGTNGIYKVLNAIDNDDDVPLYLFAADLVLQGSYVEIVEPVRKYIFYGNEKVIQDEKMVKEDKKEGKKKNIIRWEWLAGVCVPYGSSGKIRCERVELIEIVK